MENDRELLEAAARAAGLYSIGDYESSFGNFMGLCIREDDNPSGYCWNPLVSDGNALRLSVKLEQHVHCGRSMVQAGHPGQWTTEVIHIGADPNAATRRAIVRAAAAMAKDVA